MPRNERMPLFLSNTLRSLPISLLFWLWLDGYAELNYASISGLVALFVAALLSTYLGRHMEFGSLRIRRLAVPFLLGLVFAVLTAFFLAIAVSLDGTSVGLFLSLFITYILYFAILLFLPSVPLFYLMNRWKSGFLSC